MDTNSTVGLLQLATKMSEDVLTAAKMLEVLGLQSNKALFTQLSALQILLDDVYEISRPSSEDYASRRDLIRIFNDIAREIYGNNDKCPVVENFGSFLMDMFSPKSDLDLSINFSDQLFETDRIEKRRTLRKFAKKFYSLRSKGHVTTVELILSARVPVLKVTDSGSGIECDLSVGNRDGIAKSHLVLMISAIDERFRQLSFMMKAWAKAHDINSSKDGTLNSLSLILLAAFHLQTRDVPILPPFFAIFKGGMDPAAVKKVIPSFLNYGKRNNETLAELFVSLLVKLQSVETLWSRGLCASTYEGSWTYRNSKATGYISIEDFTDRSQNTARAVKSAKMNKIYSCIRRSVESIQSFTGGIIDATQLKNLLFGLGPPRKTTITNLNYSKPSKPLCSNPSKKKKKRLRQEGLVEGQRPGKQGKHDQNPSKGALEPSKTIGVNTGRKTDSASSDTQTFQGLDKLQETLTPNTSQKKKHSTEEGLVEWQRPSKESKHGHNPGSVEPPAPSRTREMKKKKSKNGKKIDVATSDTPTSFQGLDKLQKRLIPNPSQKQRKRPPKGGRTEQQKCGKQGNHGHIPCSMEGPTPSRTSEVKKKSRSEKNTNPVTSEVPTSFQGSGKSQETFIGSCQPLPVLPIYGSGGYRSQGADVEVLNNATPTFQVGQPYRNHPNQGSGVSGPQKTHIRNLSHVASSIQAIERPPLSNSPIVQYGGYGPQKTYVDTFTHAASRLPEGHLGFISNPQGSGGFRSNVTHVETLRHAAPSLLPQEPLPPFSGYRGFRSERIHAETLNQTIPSFPSNQPLPHSSHPHSHDYGGFRSERYHVETLNQSFFHSNHQHSQGYGGFRSERYHGETSRHFPYSPAVPRVSVSNQPVQGSGGLLPRMHVERPNYYASNDQSPYLANHAAGFGPEKAHAETINHTTHFQPAQYTLAPRPSSFIPHHQPYLPTATHREPAGLQRTYDPRQAFPLAPSQNAANMHPYQS